MKKAMLVTAVAAAMVGAAAARPDPKDYFKPDISYRDGTETFAGPARGYATGGWTVFKRDGLPNWRGAKAYNSSLWDLGQFSGGREQNGRRPPPERVGDADIPLSAAMKADVRRYLEETRQNGGSLIVRVGYTWSDSVGCEPSNFGVVLGHVRDLSRIMSDFDDVIVGVEAGVAGPWAEMHSSDYCRAEYMNPVLRTYCENLSSNISILVRTAAYISTYAGTNPDGLIAMLPFKDGHLKRFGMYNDGYLGTWWDYGTWAGDWRREKGCRLLNSLADHPYGGELAYVKMDWLENNRERCADLLDAGKWNIVKEWYETHLNYLRNIGTMSHPLCEFISREKFRAGAFRFDGMPDLSEYDGLDLHKFMYDHMGWRFVARDARLPKKLHSGKGAVAVIDVENTGFGKLLLPSRTEVLLVSGGKAAALPAETSKGDFASLAGAERRRVAIRFSVPKGLAAGTYDFHLRVSAPLRDEKPGEMPRRPIRFANAGMWNEELKSNSFGRVEVR